ncbi:PST family polysaccharide transporter [Alkalibacillus flavidus]|uniref:PST family polysaccharide transporter n=1 Tax=Alkalibacillus flavidus TaxID=546021 RepID=A0ABV2KYU9_9BACI
MARADEWIKGTVLLTIAGLVGKILGMVYRIPLQNLAGDEGLYIYQQIYPFVSLALLLSIYSFPSAVSHVLTHQTSQNAQIRCKNASAVFYLLGGVGLFLSVSLFVLAPWVVQLMGDADLLNAVRMSSLLFLLIPVTSFYRGWFQTHNHSNMVALSQVIEQVVRVLLIIVATVVITQTALSPYALGYAASIATIVGTVAAIGVLIVVERRQHRDSIYWQSTVRPSRPLVKSLFVGIVIYGMTHVLHLMIQMVDVLTMVQSLQQFGYLFEEAKVMKGVYDRGNPLIQLGLVFGSALAFAVVPALQSDDRTSSAGDEQLAVKVTWLLSLSASIGLIVIMPWLNPLFYQSMDGTSAIRWMMFLVFFLSVMMTISVILQRYGLRLQQLWLLALLIVLKVILNQWLIPSFGIEGASLASVVASVIVLALFLVILQKQWDGCGLYPFIMRATTTVLIMGIVVYSLSFSLRSFGLLQEENRFVLSVVVLVLCSVGVLTMAMTIRYVRLFTTEEKHRFHHIPYVGRWFQD